MDTDTVPTLDLRHLESDPQGFAAALGAAYRTYGFVGLSHHGVPDELVEDGETYFYRHGRWSNESGMCVSLTRSQQMTMDRHLTTRSSSAVLEPTRRRLRV